MRLILYVSGEEVIMRLTLYVRGGDHETNTICEGR